VRDVLEQIETVDLLGAKQDHRVGIGLLEERNQQIPDLDLILLGARSVVDRVLQHPVKGQGLARLDDLVAGDLLEVFAEEALEIALEGVDMPSAAPDDLDAALIVQQCEQEVFDRHIGVTPMDGLAIGRLQGQLQLATDSCHLMTVLRSFSARSPRFSAHPPHSLHYS